MTCAYVAGTTWRNACIIIIPFSRVLRIIRSVLSHATVKSLPTLRVIELKTPPSGFFFQIIFCFSPTTLYTSTHDRCAAISRYIVLHGGHYLQTDAIEETAMCRVPPLSPHQRSCHLSYASSRAPCDHSRPTAIIFQFFVSHSAK